MMSTSDHDSRASIGRGARIAAGALLALGFGVSALGADVTAQTQARQRLHQQQLQQNLDLSLQQGLARSQLQAAPSKRARFDALATRQRMEQQHLHHQQLIDAHRALHDPGAAALRQRLHAQESAAQLRRFEMEQRTFVRAVPPPSLQ
jgi:hypothetical protein